MSSPLNLDGELLHVLVILHVGFNGLLNDLGSFFAILLSPFSIELLIALLCLLLWRMLEVVPNARRRPDLHGFWA